MIGPGTGVCVYLASGVTDMRKGIAGLAALTQDVLRQKPASGAVFAFRGRRGDISSVSSLLHDARTITAVIIKAMDFSL